MTTHSFTITLGHVLTGEEIDALFEAGGDDTSPETSPRQGRSFVHFDREARSLGVAVASALDTLTRAGLVDVVAIVAPDGEA